MKVQLTKSKAIDLALPRWLGGLNGGTGRATAKGDLTGLELFGASADGCPAVRLYRKKGRWHLGAAAYLPAPAGELPEQWDEVTRQPTWSLPRDFQAPDAALAVNSTQAIFGQSSPEAILQEMSLGLNAAPSEPTTPTAEKKRFALKRPTAAVAKPAEMAKLQHPATLPVEGIPTSANGRRFVVKPGAEEGLYLSASLPEFQALWLGRLFPEGHRPTATSIQLAEAALMASILAQPAYAEQKGTALVIFVRPHAVFFAGYRDGLPILWRRCPGGRGYVDLQEAVKKELGLTDELLSAALDDALIDPRPALEPLLHPIFDQLELARAYLTGKLGVSFDRVLLAGLPSGAAQWVNLAEETLHLQLEPLDPFDGLIVDKEVKVEAPHEFLVALGAALAALGVAP